MDIEPAEGYVALEFLDDYEAEEKTDPGAGSSGAIGPAVEDYNNVCFAMCIGVGKKVTSCKRGDTVIVRKYARENGIKVSDDVMLVEAYLVVGKVTP